MAYFEEGSEAMVALEAMVDKVGVRNVLWALAKIAHGKATHVAENWQDTKTAKAWDRSGAVLSTLATRIEDPLAV